MRRPYGLLVAVTATMGLTALVVSQLLGQRLLDPDGFLGPAWVRLPAMVLGAFLLDIIPRSLWRARGRWRSVGAEVRTLLEEHWTRERMTVVVIGLTSFYVTYVSYRNLKGYLPEFFDRMQDPLLHRLDRLLFFGNEPATVLHAVLGEDVSAHFFAFIYLIYLPLAPMTLVVWLVWSRTIRQAYWFATAHCLTWALGTLSYYLLPTMGPNFWYVWLYRDLDLTAVSDLQDSLWVGRQDVMAPLDPFSGNIQSVAGFASLHVALTLVIALMAQRTVRHAILRWAAWVFFALTVISTLYFGWHYVADDVGGAAIAWISFWLGARATGHRVDGSLVVPEEAPARPSDHAVSRAA